MYLQGGRVVEQGVRLLANVSLVGKTDTRDMGELKNNFKTDWKMVESVDGKVVWGRRLVGSGRRWE